MIKDISWTCKSTWKRSSYNTMWCLIGCSIGDFGTILFFQFSSFDVATVIIMSLAIINGLITSILLETAILTRQMQFIEAFKTAIGMSLISMLMMEISMNSLDWIIMGGAKLNLFIIPFMLFVGFITPLPYNYWRLKKYGKDCH
ncbi:MAG: DUF4396 domain-containing protein [Pelagibacterales bacterium]|nr:DUF4396 domain-containing protein [Pelagibacterales bacterium]